MSCILCDEGVFVNDQLGAKKSVWNNQFNSIALAYQVPQLSDSTEQSGISDRLQFFCIGNHPRPS